MIDRYGLCNSGSMYKDDYGEWVLYEDAAARIAELEADAARFRWMLDGNGYFMEEAGLCGYAPDEKEKDRARLEIDEAMADQLGKS